MSSLVSESDYKLRDRMFDSWYFQNFLTGLGGFTEPHEIIRYLLH